MIAESFTILAEIGDASDRSFVITAKAPPGEINIKTNLETSVYNIQKGTGIKKCASKNIVSGRVIAANYELFNKTDRVRFNNSFIS